MNEDDSQGLLKSVLGFFARKRPQSPARASSLKSRTHDAWLRTDAYLQHDNDAFNEVDSSCVARTLRAFEDYVHVPYDSDREIDSVSSFCRTTRSSPFNSPLSFPDCLLTRGRGAELISRCAIPKAPKNAKHDRARSSDDLWANPDTSTIRVSKRKKESDAVIEELSHLDKEPKRRRVLLREEPNVDEAVEEVDATFAMLMRRHLMSLDNALRKHWVCVCQRCSGLSVRLSLPQQKNNLKVDACFEVCFGVQSLRETTLHEAKITIK